MKNVHLIAPQRRLKPKKKAKWERIVTANIALRYMEMVRLRAQVHALEAKRKQGSAGHNIGR